MSTRARIGITRNNGDILSIYTHNDGYISHHGPILLNSYDTRPKILALMKQGDCSQLHDDLESCIFYARDRGEPHKNVPARTNNTLTDFYNRSRMVNAEFVYLYHDDKWWVSAVSVRTPPEFKDLIMETVTARLMA